VIRLKKSKKLGSESVNAEQPSAEMRDEERGLVIMALGADSLFALVSAAGLKS
jgi:hypothetical protein